MIILSQKFRLFPTLELPLGVEKRKGFFKRTKAERERFESERKKKNEKRNQRRQRRLALEFLNKAGGKESAETLIKDIARKPDQMHEEKPLAITGLSIFDKTSH